MNEVPNGAIISKDRIALFIKLEEAYKRIKKSTELEISSEAVSEEYEFIDGTNEEKVERYKYSITQDLVMIQGEEDFEAFYEMWKKTPEVPEIKTEALIVYMFKGDSSSGYDAWHTDVNIIFEGMNGNDKKINFNLNLIKPEVGTATMAEGTPTFQKAKTMTAEKA